MATKCCRSLTAKLIWEQSHQQEDAGEREHKQRQRGKGQYHKHPSTKVHEDITISNSATKIRIQVARLRILQLLCEFLNGVCSGAFLHAHVCSSIVTANTIPKLWVRATKNWDPESAIDMHC